MLIEADASGLEVVAAAYLSQDPILCKEIRDGVDIHAENQKRFGFKGENGRTIAKIFKFRLIYGGTKWSYAQDSDFNWISDDPSYWQGIIDEYYAKYVGIAEWHTELVNTVIRHRRLVMPTGRIYTYQPYFKNDKWTWPRTTILNYPVQGLGADLVTIARVSAYRRLRDKCLFINSVHDSIIVDAQEGAVAEICQTFHEVFKDIPENFENLFGVEFNLPMKAEIKIGRDWKNMTKVLDKNLKV